MEHIYNISRSSAFYVFAIAFCCNTAVDGVLPDYPLCSSCFELLARNWSSCAGLPDGYWYFRGWL